MSDTPHDSAQPASASWISRFNLSQWALDHQAFTRYLMIVLMLLGVAAYFQLGQDEDPPFTFRAMVVRAYWPGATAEQVAEQVSDRIEKTLQEVPYADKIRSYSKPGETLIIFQLKDSAPPGEVPHTWYTARKKVGDMRSTLPQGVVGPFFNDEFGDVYGVIYALQGEGFSPAERKAVADDVRQQLLRVRDVSKVEMFGVQDEKLYIEISQRRLAVLGLNLQQVLDSLGQQNAVESAGAVQSPQDVVQVRVAGAFNSVDQLRAMPIRAANGTQIRLGDIARIGLGYVDPPSVLVRHNGQDSIALGISMAKGGDIISLGKALKTTVAGIEARLPAGMTLAQVQDQPSAVTSSVNEFVKVLIEAVVIVLAVSFLALGLHRREGGKGLRRYTLDIRPGLVVFITIPLVLAITFLAMYYWRIGLHKISLGSLIIALGLLVDDAIIAVEMMVRKLEEGYSMVRAATFTWEATAMPMLTGTLITAAGFLPIGLANSTTGEYTFAIFAVTVLALVISWVVAVMFVPYLGVKLLKVKPHAGEVHEVFDGPFYVRFRATVDWCVQHRWITIGATILTFVLGIVGMGSVQQQFFPDSSRPEILVDVWLPEGSSMQAMDEATKRVEKRLAAEPGVRSVSTWVGSGVPRFYLPLDQIFPQTNVSQMIVLPQDLNTREQMRKALPALLATEFPELRARVKLLPNGPPVPYPVQFRVVGSDPTVLRGLADEVKLAPARQPEHARRERQLERVGEAAAAGSGPGQGTRARCVEPVDRTGLAHLAQRQHGGAVPRWRQADRHRVAPAAGRARCHQQPGECLPAYGERSGHSLAADCQAGVRLGAGRDVAGEPRVRDHGAGRRGGRSAGRDGDGTTAAGVEEDQRRLGRARTQWLSH